VHIPSAHGVARAVLNQVFRIVRSLHGFRRHGFCGCSGGGRGRQVTYRFICRYRFRVHGRNRRGDRRCGDGLRFRFRDYGFALKAQNPRVRCFGKQILHALPIVRGNRVRNLLCEVAV